MSYSYDCRTATAVPTDYSDAKKRVEELEAELKRTSQALKEVSGERSPIGKTPDAVRATPEWKKAKRESEAAFTALRNFNSVYTKRFKDEIAQDRRDRGR